MSAVSKQDAMGKFERTMDSVFAENRQAHDAVFDDNISKMENIFKTGGIEQEAIDWLIFEVNSIKMLKLFLRNGGDMDKRGPPHYPHPTTLLLNCTAVLRKRAADSIERRELVKLIEFQIEEGANINAVDEFGITPFMNCARNGETGLCKFLVERGADPSIKRNDGGTALHGAAGSCRVDVCRYLFEDCGLDIDAEYQDEKGRPRTPLCNAALDGNIDVCSYLLKKGAKVDAGFQPLTAAAGVYSFIHSFFRMATRMFFYFSWIMEQTLFCRIEMVAAPFSCAVKKAV
jgi:ankyrin repeat protein